MEQSSLAEETTGNQEPQSGASSLKERLTSEIQKGNNILVETEKSFDDYASACIAALADTDSKSLFVIPSTKDLSKVLSISDAALSKCTLVNSEHDKSDASTSLASADDATIFIATFDDVNGKDIAPHGAARVCFAGFSAGSALPGSEDFENLLKAAEGLQLCWCSESVPLTLNGAVGRHIRVEGFSHINVAKESEVQLIHEFYEVGHELLAKPEALSTILEVEGQPRAAIFCNNPSETDLLEVLLNKRGLKAKRMIGNVPERAVRGAMESVEAGEVDVLILTDVSGGLFPIEEFDLLVHYAAPEDPETYIHRIGQPDSQSRLKRVISLVGTTDLGNFHFLKKVVEFDFQPCTLPDAEAVARLRFDKFKKEATEFTTEDQEIIEYAKLIGETGEQDSFIQFLLHQYLRVLPEALNKKGKKGRDRDNRRQREDRYDRDERMSDDGERGDRDNRRRDREERKPRPTRKDIRFYVAHGEKNDMNEDAFKAVLKEAMGEESPEIMRCCIRGLYSFFDFQESVSESVEEALKEAEYSSKPLGLMKAAVLTVPLDKEEEEEGSEASSESSEAESTEDSTEEAQPAA